MGDNYKIDISQSTIGAYAVGAGASATGSVIGGGERVSQAEYEGVLREAQKALVDDQDRLDEVADGLHEALGQVLRMARQIQVDQLSLADAQDKIKWSFDELWATQVAGKLKGNALSPTFEVTKTLLGSPLLAQVVKGWLGS